MNKRLSLYVGFPPYLNTLPLLYHLKLPPQVKLILKTPKEINQALEREELDLGLASSLYYAQNFSKFHLLPDLSISAIGKVKSVILYHNLPIKKLEGRKIGISPETETSFGLLYLVLEHFLKVKPQYERLNFSLKEMPPPLLDNLSGYLAIGDEALTLQKSPFFKYATDLAEFWLEENPPSSSKASVTLLVLKQSIQGVIAKKET